jgi:hypothetical protein
MNSFKLTSQVSLKAKPLTIQKQYYFGKHRNDELLCLKGESAPDS